jgi:hypothetical protein
MAARVIEITAVESTAGRRLANELVSVIRMATDVHARQ